MGAQRILLELPEAEATPVSETEPTGACKLRPIQRNQLTMATIDVEHLIGEQHAARGIWDVTSKLDLSRYEEPIRTREGAAGRAAWPPQLLIAIWLYGYSQGITSARELERQLEYEPGLMWLSGMQVINHHTLSDFRVRQREALTDLFAQLLVVLSEAGLVPMQLVAHDGTKIRAQAGVDSFRREETLRRKLEQARRLVEEDPQGVSGSARQQAAQQRAQRERAERAAAALEQLNHLPSSEQRSEPRVSVSEPEAQRMKHGDHAFAPSYNAQVSTDSDSGVIVGVYLTQAAGDSQGLGAALDEIEKNVGRLPAQVVADGGFTTLQAIEEMDRRGVDFYGSLPDPRERAEAAMKSHGIEPQFAPHFFILQAETRTAECPAGKPMKYLRRGQKRGEWYESYRARGADCMACAWQKQCCPKTAEKGRIVSFRGPERKVIAEFRRKMASAEGRAIYKRRGAVAEFPFAWIKERMKLRKFRLFGLVKATQEAVWASLAYNVMLWLRVARKAVAASAA